MPYCSLCGWHHFVSFSACKRCGLPEEYSPRATGLPDGWEACIIESGGFIKPLDDDHALGYAQAVRIVGIPPRRIIIKRTPPFRYRIWHDEFREAPPLRTPEQQAYDAELATYLLESGWRPLTTRNGESSTWMFWRRLKSN